MLVTLAPRIPGMATHSSLCPTPPLPLTPSFVSVPYDWAQEIRASLACPDPRGLLQYTPSWEFPLSGCWGLQVENLGWKPLGADGSHQTPEDIWAGGVSVPSRPKAKVS